MQLRGRDKMPQPHSPPKGVNGEGPVFVGFDEHGHIVTDLEVAASLIKPDEA